MRLRPIKIFSVALSFSACATISYASGGNTVEAARDYLAQQKELHNAIKKCDVKRVAEILETYKHSKQEAIKIAKETFKKVSEEWIKSGASGFEPPEVTASWRRDHIKCKNIVRALEGKSFSTAEPYSKKSPKDILANLLGKNEDNN